METLSMFFYVMDRLKKVNVGRNIIRFFKFSNINICMGLKEPLGAITIRGLY